MKNLMTVITLATTLIVCTLGFSSFAEAKQIRKQNMLQSFKHLGLEDGQKEQLKTLIKNSKQEKVIYKEEMKTIQNEIKALMQASTWDEDAVNAAMTNKVNLQKQIKLIGIKTMHSAYQLLTEEQKTLLSEKLANRKQKRADKKVKGKQDRLARILQRLALDDSQRASIANILLLREQNKEVFSSAKSTFKAQLKAMIQESEFDEQAWNDLYDANTSSMIAMDIAKAKTRFDIKATLTDKQFKAFKKRLSKSAKNNNNRKKDK